MRAVANRYGLAGAAVRAIAAGADAVCVGGGHAEEATVESLRTALVDAVAAGELAEERLADAAGRVGELAAWSRQAARPDELTGQPIGMIAARRAVRASGAGALPLAGPAHVVEFAPFTHEAIDRHTPWGVAEPLSRLLPGTTSVRLYAGDVADSEQLFKAGVEPAVGRPLVLVVRDAHRHPWMSGALHQLLGARPDAVVVEQGVPGPRPLGAVYVTTHGAARVCGEAAAELLAGE
jgi:beta-N-acetylhexosaminidase